MEKVVEKGDFNEVNNILNDSKIKLDLNRKYNDRYLLLDACYFNSKNTVKSIINYDKEKTLNLNVKDENGNFPLLWACNNNNPEIVQLLIKYANESKRELKINDKNEVGNFPLLIAINNINIEIVNELKKYADEKNITLELNEKNIYGDSPISSDNNNNNMEIIKLLTKIAFEKSTILNVNEKDIKDISKINIDVLHYLKEKLSMNIKDVKNY